MTICEIFRKQAAFTWNILRQAREIEDQMSEETLTEMNLLRLKLSHPTEVITKSFSKYDESTNGADWEWWFTGSTNKWIGFRVQAKVLNLADETYNHLHYKNTKHHQYQCDKLIESALSRQKPLIPIYCLYSNWEAQKYKFRSSASPARQSVRDYGCSILSAFVVRYLRYNNKKRDLETVIQHIKPWHSLVCKTNKSRSNKKDLPNRVYDYWKGSIAPIEGRVLRQLNPEERQVLFERHGREPSFYGDILPTYDPPDYIRRLNSGEKIPPPDEEIRYITIFRETDA